MSLIPGARLGPYEVVSALGSGGMGEVYRGRDPKLNRDVAIKILPEALAADTTGVNGLSVNLRSVVVTPDGKSHAYSFLPDRSQLFLVTGLK
jgi:serine/threonine protein kinase